MANEQVVFKDPMGEVIMAAAIPEGGGVVGFFGDRRAVVTRVNGKFAAVSATCTHAGCTVGVNADKHTLDCPCHGSRYTLAGKNLEGPAVRPLPTLNVQEIAGQIVLA